MRWDLEGTVCRCSSKRGTLKNFAIFTGKHTLVLRVSWLFFVFLNCTNGTKSRNAPQMCLPWYVLY